MAKVRLDALLHQRGLFESRTRAAAAVMAGAVRLGDAEGPRAQKPGQLLPEEAELSVDAPPPFVSRGGTKLANALDHFGLDVTGCRALDVGASTGGFTDCLLQRGATAVAALDVAYGELHWSLRIDPRVSVIERTNARALTAEELPFRPELVVADVSFISLTKLLSAVLSCTADRYDALVMVKPQFEVGRERLGKGGVVRDPALRREALIVVAGAAQACGASVLGFASSGLPGPKGNRESFLRLAEPGRPGGLDAAGIDEAANVVEPEAAPA